MKIYPQQKNDNQPQQEHYKKAAARPHKVKDGSELSDLTPEAAFKAVFTHAGRLIAIKDWSQSGMEKRLTERFKMNPNAMELAKAASLKMREIGALDDIRFARGFIRARLAKKSLQSALREVLAEGVSKDDMQAVLEELREEGLVAEPNDQAWEVWFKKFKSHPTDDKTRAKQARFMASRGFSFDVISKVWAKAKAEGL